MKKVLLLAVVVLVGISPALARNLDVSTDALVAPGSGMPYGPRTVIYFCGFEVDEGILLGPIDNQAGWRVFAANSTTNPPSTVSDLNPFAGDQHLRIVQDTSLGAGSFIGAFSPNLGALPDGKYEMSLDIYITFDGGADYQVIPQAPAQGFLTARVVFSFTGTILILDDIGAGLQFVDTGVSWVQGAYANLTIDVDYDANTLTYEYNGAPLYSGAAGVFAGTAIEEVVILHDNWNFGDEGNFDNLFIRMPEDPTPTVDSSWGLIKNLYR